MSIHQNADMSSTMQYPIDRRILNQYNDAVDAFKRTMLPRMEDPALSLISKTLTIQLDDDEDYGQEVVELDPQITEFYDPPPKAAEIRPRVAKGVCIKHLSQLARRQFEIFLDPPSLGSMYNWEYVAARLGLTGNEILYLKNQKNPTSEVLLRFSGRPLEDLLNIIRDLGRVDLLLTLRDFINERNPFCQLLTDQLTLVLQEVPYLQRPPVLVKRVKSAI